MFQRFAALALLCVGSAQAGIYADPSFGDGGTIDVVLPASFQDYDFLPPQVVVAPDRKVTVAKSLPIFSTQATTPPQVVLVRVNADGTTDTGFGSNGTQVLTLRPTAVSYYQPFSLTLLPDGDLLLFGGSVLLDPANPSVILQSELLLTRLNANGTPDPAFNGGNTLVLTGLPWGGYPKLVPQGDGILVFSLERYSQGLLGQTPAGFSVLRVGADGRPDPAFATAGVLTVPSSAGWASDSMLLPGGGFQLLYVQPPRSGVAPRNWWRRYRADGSLDTAFGSNGEQEIDNILVHGNVQPQELQPLPNGQVFATAYRCPLRLLDAQGATVRVLPRDCPGVGSTNGQLQWYGDKLLASGEFRFGGVPPPTDGTYLAVIDSNGAVDTGFGDLAGYRWRPSDLPSSSFGVAADGGAHFVLARRTATGLRIFRYQDVRGGANPFARPVPALTPAAAVLLLAGLLLLAARRWRPGL